MPVAGLKILVLIMKYQEPFKYQEKIHLRSACAIVCRRELRSLISMCICREINFIIVMNVFSVSCVCLKEIFSVHYGKCIQLAQNKTSDKHENSVFCEHHVRQSSFKCTTQRNLIWISSEKLSFSFASKAIFYVFDLSKWTKACITTVVFEVAFDLQSVKVSEYPFKQNRSM